MNRFVHRLNLVVSFLLLAVLCGGCNRSGNGGRDGSDALASSPEASYKRIVETFRRKIEDQPVGFVVSDGKTRSTMIGTNTVSSELIPPPNAMARYKAVIKVKSQSQYSLRRSKNGTEDAENDQNQAKSQTKNPLLDPIDDKGLPIPKTGQDTSTAKDDSKSGSKANPAGDEIVTRRPDEVVQTYELSFENNRWILVTALNPKTEKSIQFAFDEALAIQ